LFAALSPVCSAAAARADFQDDAAVEATPEEIKQEAEKWVRRCKICATVAVASWVAWIVTAQVLRNVLPSSLYMLNPDDQALTGW
jgi:hypothetical protein